jgi:hypothetical protein
MYHFSHSQLSKSSKKQNELSSNAHTVISPHSARFVNLHQLSVHISVSGSISGVGTHALSCLLPHPTSKMHSQSTEGTIANFFIIYDIKK